MLRRRRKKKRLKRRFFFFQSDPEPNRSMARLKCLWRNWENEDNKDSVYSLYTVQRILKQEVVGKFLQCKKDEITDLRSVVVAVLY